MAILTIYYDKRNKNSERVYPIKIAVRNKNTTSYINTNIRVHEDDWVNGQIVETNATNKKLNKILQDKLAFLKLRLLSLSTTEEIKNKKAKEIVALLEPKLEDDKKVEKISLLSYWIKYERRKDKEETVSVYEQTRSKIAKYCNIEQLQFEDITYSWLCDLEQWLSMQGNSVNTRSIHFRNLRAVYNSAIKEGLVSLDKYPFRNFVIRKEQTAKRSLTIEQLRMFRDAPCEGVIRKYKDVFMLIFYLAGINLVDLMQLPPLDSDGRIRYRRSKTGILCELQVPQEALRIIEKYKGEKRLVNFAETYASKRSFTLRVNQGLQKVGEMHYIDVKARNGATHKAKRYKALFPSITTYWARHTWATIAADLDIPDAVIDAALGHKSPYPMTDVYVRRNQRKVDDAVRKVIDYLNEK